MRRRKFLQMGSASVLTVAATPRLRAVGANNRVNVGLIGCGGRGRYVAGHMRNVAGVKFAAVCDVYEKNLASAARWAGDGVKTYQDFRQLLDDRDVDVVLIATPDHWHAMPAVLACQAGKDVYVEKPLAHNIKEGRAIVEASRKYQRVVQTGTQQRSAGHFDDMRQIVQSGQLGKVHSVRIWNYRNIYPRGIGRSPDSAPPKEVDWDFYLGPAPKVPFNRNRFVNRFRWFWDYAGGIVTDWGTHRIDSMHQVMGVDQPRSISAIGGRFELDDGGEVPDTMQVSYEYAGFIVSYEACALNAHGCGGRTPGRAYYGANGLLDRPNGLAFHGTSGTLFADRLGFEVYPELQPGVAIHRRQPEEITPDLFRMQPRDGSAADSTFLHTENFIQCVRTREKPLADVEIGHRSTIAAHLANISYRTGHKLTWDASQEAIVDDAQASMLLGRNARKPWDII